MPPQEKTKSQPVPPSHLGNNCTAPTVRNKPGRGWGHQHLPKGTGGALRRGLDSTWVSGGHSITSKGECNSSSRHLCSWEGLCCYRDVSAFPLERDALTLAGAGIFLSGSPMSLVKCLHFPRERSVFPLAGVYICSLWRARILGVSYRQEKTPRKATERHPYRCIISLLSHKH